MYKLRFTPETEAELRRQLADEALVPTVVIDSGVQCDLLGASQEGVSAPSEGLFRSLASFGDRHVERRSARSVAEDSTDADDACGASGLASPSLAPSPTTWLDEVGVCEQASNEASPGDEPRGVERAVVPFYSGQPCAELCAGSVGFYRYESPSGVLGLSPPPLRSSLLAMLNVPASMTSAELLQFIGAYLRCVRHARLVRDASRPHAHCVLLHFVTPAVGERFRRDFHGRRFNSLEPEVLLVVHVAAIELAPPQPPPVPAVRVGVTLVVTTLERGIDGSLQPAGTPTGWSSGAVETPPLVKGRSAPDWPSSRLEERNLQTAIRRSLRPTSPPAHENKSSGAPEPDTGWGPACGAGASSATDAANSPPPHTPLPVRSFRVAAQLRPTLAGRGRLRPVPPAPPLPPADATIAEALARGEAVTVDPLRAEGLAAAEGVIVAGGGCELGGSVELPMCAVCLERLDPHVSGVMTILCNHAFHCECLRRWTDSSCPVCRHMSDEASTANTCELCGTSDSLWICLVCGHVGCGRYGCGAGVLHNERTSHNFAMDLDSQRVWDYAGDNYVHRLIQNKVDGKLVELPHPGGRVTVPSEPGGEAWRRPGGGPSAAPLAELEMKQRRMEDEHQAVVHEYSVLLTGQLEVQRQHFEEQLRIAQLEQAAQLAERDAILVNERAELSRRREAVEREAKGLARRAAATDAVLAAARSDSEFNRELNAQLRANQADWAARLAAAAAREAALEEEKRELEEQLRDMSFHLEAQLKIMSGGGEAHEMTGGNVMPGEIPPARKHGKRRVGRG